MLEKHMENYTTLIMFYYKQILLDICVIFKKTISTRFLQYGKCISELFMIFWGCVQNRNRQSTLLNFDSFYLQITKIAHAMFPAFSY